MTAAVVKHPLNVASEVAWALDRSASTEIRRAAIALLAEVERHNHHARRALERIDSTDPLGLMLRYEARQAVLADHHSEILPQTAEARLAVTDMLLARNAASLRRDRLADAADMLARALLVAAVVGAGLLIGAVALNAATGIHETLERAEAME